MMQIYESKAIVEKWYKKIGFDLVGKNRLGENRAYFLINKKVRITTQNA